MKTLDEIEAAIPKLTAVELERLSKIVQIRRNLEKILFGHSILSIPKISVGRILRPFSAEDDLLGEMIESRK